MIPVNATWHTAHDQMAFLAGWGWAALRAPGPVTFQDPGLHGEPAYCVTSRDDILTALLNPTLVRVDLLNNPTVCDELRADPERIAAFVDEQFRHRSPVPTIIRTTTADTAIRRRPDTGRFAGGAVRRLARSHPRRSPRIRRRCPPLRGPAPVDAGAHGVHRGMAVAGASSTMKMPTPANLLPQLRGVQEYCRWPLVDSAVWGTPNRVGGRKEV